MSSRTNPLRHRRRLRRRGLPVSIAATALLAMGCVSDGGSDQGADAPATTVLGPDDIVLTAALRTAHSCDALLSELKAEALEHVGPFGLGGGPGFGPVLEMDEERAVAAEDTAGSAAPAPAAGGDGSAVSGTNTQEEGVDEADVVKTDGRRLVVVSGQTVRVVDVTGAAPQLERTIELPEGIHGGELFLDGDRAVLLSSVWVEPALEDDAMRSIMPAGRPMARLVELDLAAGRLARSIEVSGGYLSARAVGDTIRVVIANASPELPFVHPANPAAADAAEAANRAVVEQSTIEQWLPTYRTSDGDGTMTEQGPIVPCERLHLPGQFAGFGSIAVLSLPRSGPLELAETVGVLTDGQTVYASTDRLVVATPQWVDPRIFQSGDQARIAEATEDHSTALHTFDITDAGRVSYVASGMLDGRVLNQFSLDEHDGLVRVATTEGQLWGENPDSESFVTVLQERGEQLEVVGRVGGLGAGEQIQSVRFLDEVAYVVTFRQTDPFYVVDLSDPTAPVVTGELKIPGFSSYLHPLSEDLVLGVGQDATDQGQVTGAQVSLFDVSDPASPTRTAQLGLGQDSWSLAAQDHRALLWWPAERLAVLPLSQFRWTEEGGEQENFDGAVLVRISESGELSEVGRLTHPATEECVGQVEPMPADDGDDPARVAPPEECYAWQPPISRSVVVGDVLYTISDGGVLATNLPDLAPRGFVAFPR